MVLGFTALTHAAQAQGQKSQNTYQLSVQDFQSDFGSL